MVGGKVLERVANGVFDLRAYAIDRFSRIWVPLVPALFFTAGVALFWGRPVSSFDFIGNLLGLQGAIQAATRSSRNYLATDGAQMVTDEEKANLRI